MNKPRSMAEKGLIDFSDLAQGRNPAGPAAPAAAGSERADAGAPAASAPFPGLRPRSGVSAIGRSISVQQELHDARERLKEFEDAKLVVKLDPKLIYEGRWKNRDARSFETDDFRQLKAEIQAAGGNVQAVKVRRVAGRDGYEIVYGRRRTRACLELGLPVNAVVEDGLSDQLAYMEMYRENTSRKDLTPWEQGVMYDDALQQGLFPSLRRLADALGVAQSNAVVAVKLARLPQDVLEAFPSPLDLQYRWALPLEQALERDPERLLRTAAEIKASTPRPDARQTFDLLTGKAGDASPKREGLKVGRKLVGALEFSPQGGLASIKLKGCSLSLDATRKVLELVRSDLKGRDPG